MNSTQLPEHVDHLDQPRKLGLLPPTLNCNRMRAAARTIGSITPIIPRSQWAETHNLDNILSSSQGTSDWNQMCLNQGQIGRCVAGSNTGANAVTRYMRTGKVVVGSMAWLYSQICGGADNGAPISSAQTVMLSTGIPTVSVAPDNPQHYNPQPMPVGCTVLKEDEAIAVNTPEDIATGLISLGGFTQTGINVTSSFENFTSAGLAWGGKLPPPGSNHSIYIIDLKNVSGMWCWLVVNDWNGISFGPFGNGTFLMLVDGVDSSNGVGGWLHLSQFDSDDQPPVPAAAD